MAPSSIHSDAASLSKGSKSDTRIQEASYPAHLRRVEIAALEVRAFTRPVRNGAPGPKSAGYLRGSTALISIVYISVGGKRESKFVCPTLD